MEEASVAKGRHYTISAAARELGKHRHTVTAWIRRGFYPVTRIGNSVRISEEVLFEMAERPDGRHRKSEGRYHNAKVSPVMQGVQVISGTYYTVSGAAVELERHRNTITRWVNEGRLPAIKLGRAFLIPEEAIRDLAGQIDVQESDE